MTSSINNHKQVDDHVLCKVIEWCEHHRNDAMTSNNKPGSNSLGQVTKIDEWDQQFFGDDNDTAFETMLVGPHDCHTLVKS